MKVYALYTTVSDDVFVFSSKEKLEEWLKKYRKEMKEEYGIDLDNESECLKTGYDYFRYICEIDPEF